MIRLFYYEIPHLGGITRTLRELNHLVKTNFTENDLLILDQTFMSDLFPVSEHSNMVISHNQINYEQLSWQKLNNIYLYDFNEPEIRRDNVIEKLVKLKSKTCDIFGISTNNQDKTLKDANLFIKEMQKNNAGLQEISILLSLKDFYSESTINAIMDQYICKNKEIDLKTVASFEEIIKYKRV